jgi:hypothetical protein
MAAGNAGIASRLPIGRHWPGVPEPQRWTGHVRFAMLKRFTLLIVVALTLAGCSTTKPIGGPYYLRSVKPLPSWEPSYGSLHLLYREGSRTMTIDDQTVTLGAFDSSIHRQFNWKVYGRNLTYVALCREPMQSTFRLFVYSERNGNQLVDADFSGYWKVIADDTGIICHRYQKHQERASFSEILPGWLCSGGRICLRC